MSGEGVDAAIVAAKLGDEVDVPEELVLGVRDEN